MTADDPAYRWAADVFGHMTADDPGHDRAGHLGATGSVLDMGLLDVGRADSGQRFF